MTAKSCPCCGATAELTRYDICQPCTAGNGWEPRCVPCQAEQRGLPVDAGMEHELTCWPGQKAARSEPVTPAERHAAVLDALACQRRRSGGSSADGGRHSASLDGRRRILERHAPDDHHGGCGHCPIEGTFPPFPCDDYRDAAAGLLPEEAA